MRRRDAPDPGQQLLMHNGEERRAELDPDLLLLLGGEDVDHAVDRLGSVVGVQRGEDEVPVSATVNAIAIDSRSRISPTRTTSGSSRSALRNADAKEAVSTPTSR